MRLIPDPAWPVVVLAAIQLVDGVLCIGPVEFVGKCFRDVNFPERWWWTVPIVKFAATAGLVAGLWLPGLGLVTSLALIAYFVVAITMHISGPGLRPEPLHQYHRHARDLRGRHRDLFRRMTSE